MKKTIAVLAFICVGLEASPARAQTFPNLGEGNISCGSWLSDRISNQSLDDKGWILGYITGVNGMAVISINKTIKMNTDDNGIFGWIDNFCQKNPTDTLQKATNAALASIDIENVEN